MKCFTCDFADFSLTASKRASQKNLQQLTKVRKKLTEGRISLSVASPTMTSKDGLNWLHPKECRTSEICTVQKEKSNSAIAAQLCGLGESISNGEQDIANAPNTLNQIGLYHGEERDKSGPHKDKLIQEGSQMPSENAALMGDQQETDSENVTAVSSDKKLFLSELASLERLVFAPSPEKHIFIDTESSALENACSKNGIEMGRAVLENNYTPNGICNSNEQEPSWNQTHDIAITDTLASCNAAPSDQSHPVVISRQQGICDILTPMAMHDRQMERGKACREKSHEANEVKTDQGSPCAKYLSKEYFQGALASPEPKIREDDLSSMHELLQKPLYEEEDWANAFPCASTQVKGPAAVTDRAKEVRGWNITRDGSGGQHVPGNLTEDNQLVTKLAIAMEVHGDPKSLLKTDEVCHRTSVGQCHFALPVEADAMNFHSAFGWKTEESYAPLPWANLRKEKYPEKKCNETQLHHSGSIQPLLYPEGMNTSNNTFQSCEAESPCKFTDISGSPLKQTREILSAIPGYYLGKLSSVKQHVHCKNSPIASHSDEILVKGSHAALHQSRINKGTEYLVKEGLSSNLSGKNTNQFRSAEHSSVATVNKKTEEKFQEKGTELELNEQSNSNSSIYRIFKGNDRKGIQTISDPQNYSCHIQEANSVIGTDSKVYWDVLEVIGPNNKRIGGGKKKPVFTASYKVRFFTEILLQIHKHDKSSKKEEHREIGAAECRHVLKTSSSDSQTIVSENNSSTDDQFYNSDKRVGLDFESFPSHLVALNAIQPSCIFKDESSRTNQDSQNGRRTTDNQKSKYESDNTAELGIVESLLQTESMQDKIIKDKETEISELGQGQHQSMEKENKTQVVQYDEKRHLLVAHDIEEDEIEPYMRAQTDTEQIHSWHDGYQKVGQGNQGKIILCERDVRETEKPITEYYLEEAEVEPYMKALLNAEQMYSWHDSLHYVHPSTVFANEELDMTGGELVGECEGASTDHNQDAAFKDHKRQILNSPECAVGMLSSTSPSFSKNRYHSEEQLAQVTIQPCTIRATTENLCMLKEEKPKLQEASKLYKASSHHSRVEDVKRRQETVKKKIVPKVQIKRQRLETKENVFSNTSCIKKNPKVEADLTHKQDKKESWKLTCKNSSKAPVLLKKIQAEPLSDFSGNIKLCCQFGEIHVESTITWMKDSKLLARTHRSAGDDFPVSLVIVQAGGKDQGLYQCCLKNMYGKATAEFNLTPEVLEHLFSFQDVKGLEEIEFLQLMFRDDVICDTYLSKSLRGCITTEELHFGEGVHRKAFRSKVLQGLVPVFRPGHPCVLKVHSAIAYGIRNDDELMKKNYKLALQECCVQNTAREYAKIYAAEAKPLEGFGEVPEIIPIFLVHRPKNNIPYATVEEELIGEFVKYSVKDGKEINFTRRDSEAGQKCCTFQHWVYERTNGSLLVTDMQGVGMKLTDVGIATLAKGYKGFKGNCSISFIDQFKALHQCNKYCEMLGLIPLRSSNQKQRKQAAPKIKTLPNSSPVKKCAASAQTDKKT